MPAKRYFNGENRTRLYRIWANMKTRCSNPKTKCFPHYGGKGIVVCDAWHDFVVFQGWAVGAGYSDTLEIDRTDASKNYCPENCRWITHQQQVLNRPARPRKHLYKGAWLLSSGTWRAFIQVESKRICLGYYATQKEAAHAYDTAAKKHFGEFARLNFP